MDLLSFHQLEALDTERRQTASEMLAFYEDDLDGIVSQIRKGLAARTKADFNTLPFVPINLVEFIVDELAALYKEPPTRQLSLPTPDTEDQAALEEVRVSQEKLRTFYADAMKDTRINAATKTALSYAWLHNTSLCRPVWDTKNARLRFEVYSSADTVVLTEKQDYRTPTLVAYRRSEVGPDGKTPDPAWYVWTPELHYRVSRLEPEPTGVGNNAEMVNPYRTLDIFSVLRLKDKREFWGGGAHDLWKANIEVVIQWMLLLRNAMWQGFSIPLAVNLGLGKFQYDEDKETGQLGVVVSPGIPIEAEQVDKDLAPPSLTFVTPEPLLEEVSGVVERLLRMLAIRYHFDAKKVALAVVGPDTQSGVSKAFDSAAIEEIRTKTMDPCRDFEQALYRAAVIVYNQNAEGAGLPEAGFEVDFAEPAVKQTDKEVREDRDWRLGKNMATVPEFMLEDNPDLLSTEAAVTRWRENAKLNEELSFGVPSDNPDEEDPDNPDNQGDQGNQGDGGTQ